jgi:peptidoglycan/xylan/chitin deacetylase (PgdA/CDA1 family)
MQENQQFPRISVVIPTRNEAQNLHHVLPYIPPVVSEVILVDGYSTDNTVAVAQQLLPAIQIIKQKRKGKGDALRVGFAASTGDIIVMIDADGSTDPNEITRFVEALLEGNDFAKGSRFIEGGGSHDITPLRALGNYGLSQMVNILFGTQYSDLCYGYNAFWKRSLDCIHLDCDGFEIETQLNIRMHRAGLKIVEVPSMERPRFFGQSNLRTFRDGWRVLKMIVKERMRLARAEKKKVPILMYHSISDHATPKFKQFTVSPKLFAEHMAYLHQHRYTPMTVTQFAAALSQRGARLPERPVILTFDDGFADFYTEGLPVLRGYGFAATLYIATAFINGTSRWLQREGETARPMLTWDQLSEISASGIECGGHSHSHPQLDTLSQTEAYGEIVQSKRLLEQHLDQDVASFAYPFGYHTASIRQQVQEAGYTSACAVKHAMSSETSNPFALARLPVKSDTGVDALAALVDGHSSQVIATMYARARTPVWQLARRSSASMTRRLQEGPCAR